MFLLGVFFLLGGGLGGGSVPDPFPYSLVPAAAEWTDPRGRVFSFCLLGYVGEPRARTIAVYEKNDGGWSRLFLDRERGFNPWAIKLAELDGDSLPEVAVGAYKSTRFDPVSRNRLLIFDWTENQTLFPKWLGSRLGLPFLDFGFTRGPDGLDRLVTIEHRDTERLVLRQYHWNGFGFTHDRDLIRVSHPPDFAAAERKLRRKLQELEKEGMKE